MAKKKKTDVYPLATVLMGAKISELVRECSKTGVKITIIIEPRESGPLVL